MGSFGASAAGSHVDAGSGGGVVARAFELAASGAFAKLDDIRRQLFREGYPLVHAHLAPGSIRRQLTAIRKAAWEARMAGEPKADTGAELGGP